MKNCLKPLDKERILELHAQGYSNPQIAKMLGYLRTSVYRITVDPKNIRYPEKAKLKAIELRKTGMIIKDIANELGLSRPTITRYLKGVKYEKPPVVNICKGIKVATRRKPKVVKAMKLKKVKKEIVPQEIARDYLNKGFEKGEMPTGVKLRDDRDFGRPITLLYSDFSDKPTVRTTIMVRDSVSDEEAVERWCKKLCKKSWKLIK